MSDEGWLRVSTSAPCQICGKPDWCLVSADGSAAICPRIESPKRAGDAGWLHPLRDADEGHFPRRFRTIRVGRTGPRRADLLELAAGYERAVDPDRLGQLATSLGLSTDSLRSLRVGWSAGHGSWAFPMTDAAGNVLGIRLRRPGGSKFAVRGGREGLHIPAVEPADSPLLACEGVSDAAALLELGFRNVVGRPSCWGAGKLLADLIRQRAAKQVVIVADGDRPGRLGAGRLARDLIAHAPSVRVVAPPAGLKDLRAWFTQGATRGDVERAIAAAPERQLIIQIVRTGEGDGR